MNKRKRGGLLIKGSRSGNRLSPLLLGDTHDEAGCFEHRHRLVYHWHEVCSYYREALCRLEWPSNPLDSATTVVHPSL